MNGQPQEPTLKGEGPVSDVPIHVAESAINGLTGRALDALVHEKVMGGTVDYTMTRGELMFPFYSTDIAHAWLVVEWLRVSDYEVYIYDERETAQHARGWEVLVSGASDEYTSKLCATAPLAICRAALAAMWVIG